MVRSGHQSRLIFEGLTTNLGRNHKEVEHWALGAKKFALE